MDQHSLPQDTFPSATPLCKSSPTESGKRSCDSLGICKIPTLLPFFPLCFSSLLMLTGLQPWLSNLWSWDEEAAAPWQQLVTRHCAGSVTAWVPRVSWNTGIMVICQRIPLGTTSHTQDQVVLVQSLALLLFLVYIKRFWGANVYDPPSSQVLF